MRGWRSGTMRLDIETDADGSQARRLAILLLCERPWRTSSRTRRTRELGSKDLAESTPSRIAGTSDELRSEGSNRSSRRTASSSWRLGMTSSLTEIAVPAATNVVVTDDTLTVDLSDGRTISVPLAWYPRLAHGTPEERSKWRLLGRGEGIHWPQLDDDISVEGLIAGRPSGESRPRLRDGSSNGAKKHKTSI